MILGSILGSVAGSVAAAGVNKLLSGGGGGGAFTAFNLPNIEAGGIRVSPTPAVFGEKGITRQARLDVNTTPERQALVQRLSDVFADQAGEIGALRPQVAPGFGRLTESTRKLFDSARTRGLSDLRDTLSRGRISTSSIGLNRQSNFLAELAQREDATQAENFIREIGLSFDLIQAESEAQRQSVQTFISELNLQAEIATRIASGAAGAIDQAEQARLQILSANAEGSGQLSGLLGSGVAGLAGKLFGGGDTLGALTGRGGFLSGSGIIGSGGGSPPSFNLLSLASGFGG